MRPLVFVHGFMGGSEQWLPQTPLGKARELIWLDLPGFGNNAHLEPIDSIGGFADWVLHQLSDRGVQQFDLLGHSMGGMIAQEITRRAPERVVRLVLYGTGPIGVMPGRYETIETSMQRAQSDGPEATAKRISATWFLASEESTLYPACAAIAENSTLPAILAGLRAMQAWSGEGNLSRVQSPTLVLWGEGDRAYLWPQVEQLWKTVPNCHLAVVPDCSHAVHMERPAIFNLLVSEFLATH